MKTTRLQSALLDVKDSSAKGVTIRGLVSLTMKYHNGIRQNSFDLMRNTHYLICLLSIPLFAVLGNSILF